MATPDDMHQIAVDADTLNLIIDSRGSVDSTESFVIMLEDMLNLGELSIDEVAQLLIDMHNRSR